MAYVVGVLSEEEERVLVSRGWEVEPAPRELVPENAGTDTPESQGDRFRMVWVDSSMFQIMNGPDWDKRTAANENGRGDCHADGQRD
jgi:hypothetical protein